MKYLCLAYGAEDDWKALTKAEQDALLAQDQAIRERGALMGAVKPDVVTLRAWEGTPEIREGSFSGGNIPLAGFSIIEAADIHEVIAVVAKTPCARAKGAIEIRSILFINDND